MVKKQMKTEQGFTLVEVIAALTILMIVSLVLSSFFIQALTYTKHNETKTIKINLARNALVYIEKQNFQEISAYFNTETQITCPLTMSTCQITGIPSLDPYVTYEVLNPVINGIQYQVSINYQQSLQQLLDSDMSKYLLPVHISVVKADEIDQHPAVLEGYISNAAIR